MTTSGPDLKSRLDVLALAVDLSGIGVWSFDHSTKHFECCVRTLEILGFHADDKLSLQDLKSIIHPSDRAQFEALFAKPPIEDQEFVCRMQRRGSDHYHWVELKIHGSQTAESHKQPLGTIREVSKQMNSLAEKESDLQRLEQSNRSLQREMLANRLVLNQATIERERLKTILQQMPAGVMIADAATENVLLLNDDARHIFIHGDIAEESIEDFKTWKALHLDGRKVAPEDWPLARALRTGEVIKNETFMYQNRDGQRGYMRVGASPIRNSAGVVVAGVVTFFDITADKQLEETLHKAKLGAEEANRAKSAFLANMSHEIRTPLGAIMGFVDLLRLNPSAEDSDEFLEIIQRNGENLAQLINDILDLSKVEADHLEIIKAPTPLAELMSEITGLLYLKARDKGVSLTVSSIGTIPELILTDAPRLRQILVNIIGNAIKFTKAGHVNVQITETAPNVLTFFVKDTGIGITSIQRERLFKPFSQADESTTRKFGGTGLGLALARKLAHALGGDVQLHETTPGIGSVFAVTIPIEKLPQLDGSLRENFAETISNAKDISIDGLVGLRVLVVEDAPDGRALMQQILKRHGIVADFAVNGREAIDKAMTRHPDIILMDIQMPIIDGYCATEILRKQGYTKPIIALTAHALKDEREKCLAAGCDEHLTKPVNAKELIRTLRDYTASQAH